MDVHSRARYRTHGGVSIGTAEGTVAMAPFQAGEPLLHDRDIYVYSDAEIRSLEADLHAVPPRRGSKPRYWSEVREGELLPSLVKGPLSYHELSAWRIGAAKPGSASIGAVAHRDVLARPGRRVANPSTGWPYLDVEQTSGDLLSVQALGFKTPVSPGLMRFALAGQVLTNWMGDLGFLRRLSLDLPNHFCYADTLWVGGQVTRKYVEQVGSASYFAVEVQLSGHNQVGEALVEGAAVVYLPENGRLVGLPIGNPWP